MARLVAVRPTNPVGKLVVGLDNATRQVRTPDQVMRSIPNLKLGKTGNPGREGTVNLLKLSGSTGMVGSAVGLCGLDQAAVAVPVTSFQVVNRPAISCRYSSAPSR